MNLFKCDWCDKVFSYEAPIFPHLCEINIPEVGIGTPEMMALEPPAIKEIILSPLPKVMLPHENLP